MPEQDSRSKFCLHSVVVSCLNAILLFSNVNFILLTGPGPREVTAYGLAQWS